MLLQQQFPRRIDKQIRILKDLGITFELMQVDKAKIFLRKETNFKRFLFYMQNFETYVTGHKKGQYIALDFGQVAELIRIDRLMRKTFKVMLDSLEDYWRKYLYFSLAIHNIDLNDVIEKYVVYLNSIDNQLNYFNSELEKQKNNQYTKPYFLDDKLSFDTLTNIAQLGRLIDLYDFSAKVLNIRELRGEAYKIRYCKSLRNVCAHNGSILLDLTYSMKMTYLNPKIRNQLKELSDNSVRQNVIIKALNVPCLQDIAVLFYCYKQMLQDAFDCDDVDFVVLDKLHQLLICSISLFENHKKVCESLNFVEILIDKMVKDR